MGPRRSWARQLRGLFASLLGAIWPSPEARHLARIAQKGQDISYLPGFLVYKGHQNVRLGSHIRLADTLINAGTKEGVVVIEDDVFFGHHVQLLARGHDINCFGHERQESIVERPIIIRRGAWIASGAIVLGGVVVGQHSVVAAGSVVTKDVPDYAVVAGNPAQILRTLQPAAEDSPFAEPPLTRTL